MNEQIMLFDEEGNEQLAIIEEIFEMNGKNYLLASLLVDESEEEIPLILFYYTPLKDEEGFTLEPVEDEDEIEMVEVFLNQLEEELDF